MKNPLQLLMGANAAILGVLFAVTSIIAMFGYFMIKMGLETKYVLLALGGLLLLLIIFGAIYFIWKFIQRKRGDQLEGELGQDAASKKQQKQQAKVAVQDISNVWGEAMATLKATKVKIYDLPWLLLIGEPQSGKTTTLRESGLDFPLGKDALSGSGGTVNCDWWFTNESVILDTAGRFTMPVDDAPDRQEWHAFLKMLVKYRPRCPINGVIITIPATSLLEDDPQTIESKARTIQEKLHELVKVLGIEFPVYVMVSKLDLVYGFAEFCASLSSAERSQALGWNRKEITSKGFNKNEYDTFFASFVNRLHCWSLRRLRDIPSGNEADRVYAFPVEFNRLKDSLAGYMELMFREDRFHIPLLLRGCYFSSGLQEGRSIAKALLGGAGGASQSMMAEFAQSFVQSRAYFINVFYRKVFREKHLVKRAGKSSQRELTLRIAAAIFAVIFFFGAGWMLLSGYKELKNNVRPMEVHVKKAQSLLLTEGVPKSAGNVQEIISVIDTLEAGRQRLQKDGAKRFLKSRENTIVRDLGRIEDALVERKLMGMLINATGEKFSSASAIASPAEKENFYKAMLQYIDYLAGDAITQDDLLELMAFAPWQGQLLTGVSRSEIGRLLTGYPYGDTPATSSRKVGGALFHMRKGLSSLQDYWKSYYARKWAEQQQLFQDINTSYEALLAMSINQGDSRVKDNFKMQLATFTSAVDSLTGKGEKQIVWSAELRDKCFSDYLMLQDTLTDKGLGEIAALASTAERHSEVCGQLTQNVGAEWTSGLRMNSHILQKDGVVNTEVLEILRALQKTLEFGPLFTSEKQQKLRVDPGAPLALLDFWNQGWQEQSAEKFKEIGSIIAPVSSKSWKKDDLAQFIKTLLDYSVWEADRDAVLEAMPAVLDSNGLVDDRLKPGAEPPRLARAGWLASRFELLKKMDDWLKAKHPESSGRRPVREKMGGLMVSSWRNCLKFWGETFKEIKPGEDVLETTNWQNFRRAVVSAHGMMLDPATWPMDSFLDFMALKEFQEVTRIMTRSVDKALTSSKLRALEGKVEKTAYVYNISKYLPKLEQAQGDFYNCIQGMSDNAALAWTSLKQGKVGSDPVSMAAFKSLSDFGNRVDRDAESRGEQLAMRLLEVETHGFNLLRKEVASDFDIEWQGFQEKWRTKLAGKFPFGEVEGWKVAVTTGAGIKNINFKMGSPDDLHEFFFDPKTGFDAFIKRHGLQDSKTVGESDAMFFLSNGQKLLLTKLGDWRDFLFNDKGRPKIHKVEIVLDTDGQGSALEGASQFTQIRFNGLETEKGQMLRLRFSGRKYKRGEFVWSLDSSPEVTVVAKNEETAEQSTLKITGGALVLPGTLIAMGERDNSTRLAEWALTLQMPQPIVDFSAKPVVGGKFREKVPGYKRGEIDVPLRVNWDEALPANVLWPVR